MMAVPPAVAGVRRVVRGCAATCSALRTFWVGKYGRPNCVRGGKLLWGCVLFGYAGKEKFNF